MLQQTMRLKGVVRGKTIELEDDAGFPDGQAVTVKLEPIKPIPPERSPDEIPKLELWVDRLVFDSSAHATERIVKGTKLAAEELVAELEQGRNDEDMLRNHAELTRDDLIALREYAKMPVGLRRSFGAWAEDAEELDRYIESVYEKRPRHPTPSHRVMNFLIDTDTCSAYFKDHAAVYNRFLQYMGRLHVSTITMSELFDWARRAHASPKRLLKVNDLLNDVTVLDVDLAVARKYGELQAAFRDVGQPAPEMDLLIGSTALIHGLILVAHNVQDFANIPGLHIVDWLGP